MSHRSAARASLLLLALAAPLPALAQGLDPISVSPALPSSRDRLVFTIAGFGDLCGAGFETPRLEGQRIVIAGYRVQSLVPCEPQQWRGQTTLAPIASGLYLVEVSLDDAPYASEPLEVRPGREVLELHGGRFRASLGWSHPSGPGVRAASAVQLSEQSGYFSFLQAANPEVLLKILDGRPINGHFWVLVASLTTLEFRLTVLDVGADAQCLTLPVVPPACPTRVYFHPPSRNRNFFDLLAFPID